jgi:ABC-type polysaccharide/polyol phosphate transport system ATPase subunit
MSDTVVKVEGLHKKFCQSLKRSLFYGTIDAAKSMFGFPIENVDLRKKEFWALQDINFELKHGETLGLIGQNGSGKTTLLRLINGIFPPDKGKIMMNGRIGALIAVGAGFHPHMTGRENIYLNGTILGMTKTEIRRKLDEIIDFADIGDFIDAPVATYSSGMTVRLGFAIAINCEPDILLIDEILAVGDVKFQRKCLDRLKEIRKNGASIIIVSHNLQNIEAMAEKSVLLNYGQVKYYGLTKEAIPIYELLLLNKTIPNELDFKTHPQQEGKLNIVFQHKDWGTTHEIVIEEIDIINSAGNSVLQIYSDESVSIVIKINAEEEIKNVLLYIRISYTFDKINLYNDKNIVCLGIRRTLDIRKGKSILQFKFDKLQLKTGSYQIAPYFYDWTFTQPYFQACYGYFDVKKEYPTMLNEEHPIFWKDPELIVR